MLFKVLEPVIKDFSKPAINQSLIDYYQSLIKYVCINRSLIDQSEKALIAGPCAQFGFHPCTIFKLLYYRSFLFILHDSLGERLDDPVADPVHILTIGPVRYLKILSLRQKKVFF